MIILLIGVVNKIITRQDSKFFIIVYFAGRRIKSRYIKIKRGRKIIFMENFPSLSRSIDKCEAVDDNNLHLT